MVNIFGPKKGIKFENYGEFPIVDSPSYFGCSGFKAGKKSFGKKAILG
jgi:hypothetical protein